MKSVLMKIRYIAFMLCSMGAITSCSDFLGTVPLNEIVLENFWENEEEVNSVVMSCYSRMAQGDFLTRLILWGELRSDNVVAGNITGDIPYVNNNDQLMDMLAGNILPNHYIADWSSFYSVINRCNTVLHYAPDVLDRDPDYNLSEWNYQKAEMLTLRALCYFYLVRSFRDVPFVTEPTIDDSRDFKLPAADPDSVLNELVKDLREAEVHALKEFPEGSSYMYSYSKARVTKLTVWALLADIYLWMGNYDECIAYCEKVIEAKIEEAEKNNMSYYGDYPLIANQKSTSSNGTHMAYMQIFGMGFSFESIFEMPFGYNYEDKRDALRSYYGSIDVSIGAMSASTFIAEGAKDGNDIFKSSDIRAIESFDITATGTFPIHKYVCYSIGENGTLGYSGYDYANWIFYRLTDVMLMEAEALVERNDSVDSKKAVDLEKAFELVSAVYERANLKGDALNKRDYKTQEALRELVLLERHRELMFEGKRWFDLVRKARREGNNDAMLKLATRKFTNPGSVKSKWIKPDMLYLPIHEDELKVNTMLVQNPEYETEKTITTAK